MKSINPWQSVIQTIYNIVKAHGRKIKEDLQINYTITCCLNHGLIGLKDYTDEQQNAISAIHKSV